MKCPKCQENTFHDKDDILICESCGYRKHLYIPESDPEAETELAQTLLDILEDKSVDAQVAPSRVFLKMDELWKNKDWLIQTVLDETIAQFLCCRVSLKSKEIDDVIGGDPCFIDM